MHFLPTIFYRDPYTSSVHHRLRCTPAVYTAVCGVHQPCTPPFAVYTSRVHHRLRCTSVMYTTVSGVHQSYTPPLILYSIRVPKVWTLKLITLNTALRSCNCMADKQDKLLMMGARNRNLKKECAICGKIESAHWKRHWDECHPGVEK